MFYQFVSSHLGSIVSYTSKHSDMISKPSESNFGNGKPPSTTGNRKHSYDSLKKYTRTKNLVATSASMPVIPYHTQRHKNESEDQQKSSSGQNGYKNPTVTDRSYSCPNPTRKSSDRNESLKSFSKQLSLFQSPFDSECGSEKELYRYDVNISCHANQMVWVEEFLLPILENELGLKCYLYDRDNLPGVSTVKNIAAAVKESRLTLLCFSKDYLRSSWQNYEALLAHHLDPGGWKKRVLPIIVENCDLPFKYTMYATLKWPESSNTETVPASVKLRRKFFISGLLNALGIHNKDRELEVYKAYCGMKVPVSAPPTNRYCFV